MGKGAQTPKSGARDQVEGGLGCATLPAHVPAHVGIFAVVVNLGRPGEGLLRGLHGSLGGE